MPGGLGELGLGPLDPAVQLVDARHDGLGIQAAVRARVAPLGLGLVLLGVLLGALGALLGSVGVLILLVGVSDAFLAFGARAFFFGSGSVMGSEVVRVRVGTSVVDSSTRGAEGVELGVVIAVKRGLESCPYGFEHIFFCDYSRVGCVEILDGFEWV